MIRLSLSVIDSLSVTQVMSQLSNALKEGSRKKVKMVQHLKLA